MTTPINAQRYEIPFKITPETKEQINIDEFSAAMLSADYKKAFEQLSLLNNLNDEQKILIQILDPKNIVYALREGLNIEFIQDNTNLSAIDFNNALNELKKICWFHKNDNKIFLSGPFIMGQKPFEEFAKDFQLGFLSTEQKEPITNQLSKVFDKDPINALKLLLEVDKRVIKGTEEFNDKFLDQMSNIVYEALKNGHKIIEVGSGSSGRLALNHTALWNSLCKKQPALENYQNQIVGVIAGDETAFIRAKEGHEDNPNDGKKAVEHYNVQKGDVVFLISASGSASFNVGFANAAKEKNAHVFYFYNSQEVPERTQELFDKNIAQPLLIDIRAQAITGSTRLQGQTIGICALGQILKNVAQRIIGTDFDANELNQMHALAIEEITLKLPDIKKVIDIYLQALKSDMSNFFENTDKYLGGYITYVGTKNVLRNILIENSELPPTYCVPRQRLANETVNKKAYFQAYSLEDNENLAWQTILNKKDFPKNIEEEFNDFCLSINNQNHIDSYTERPLSENNVFVAVYDDRDESEWPKLLNCLKDAKNRGAKTILITCGTTPQNIDENTVQLNFETMPLDDLGLFRYIQLKEALNLISNGTMIGMNKVFGNDMIDVKPSNNKLIDRCIRLIQNIYKNILSENNDLNYETLYHYVVSIRDWSTKQKNKYIPSTVKMACTMIKHRCSFNEAIEILKDNKEDMEKILTS